MRRTTDRERTRQTGRAAFVLLAFSVLVGLLAAGLRPDAFFVGDQGVKLASTRNALLHPTAPLNIPLPRIAGDPVPHVENFFVIHGDHSHAVTSELFPLLSAPFLGAFGIRGLYALPAFGLIATLAACAWLSVVLDPRRSTAIVMTTALIGTPLLFYGLEFWEHTPALAAGVAGVALLLDRARRRPGNHSSTGWTFVAGILCGLAIVLRLEAACFVAVAMLASRMLVHRPTWRSLGVAAAGIALALLPLELYSVIHFGSFVPGHIGANAALVGGSWVDQRLEFARAWLVPSLWTGAAPRNPASVWSVALVAVVAVAGTFAASERRERSYLWVVAVLTVLFTLLTAPNDGGGQWGPRYLLFAYVPLTLLAADVLQEMRKGPVAIAMIVLLVAGGVWIQRAAYRQLRGTKATYGQIVDFVDARTEPDGYVVTDVWWLDQLAASALDHRTMLFAGSAETGREIVRRLSDQTVPSITVFRSRQEHADTDGWTSGTCYFEEAREELPVRGLVAVKLRHRCGYVQ